MLIKDVANLAGVSVRTLHYYDEIELLTPDMTTDKGYRVYSERNLADLQQILFYRELDFPLKKIKHLLQDNGFKRLEILKVQREKLKQKRTKLQQLIQTIEKTIADERGERIMTKEEKFQGFDFSSNPYEEEARQRFGDEAIEEVNETMQHVSKSGQENVAERINTIFRALADVRHLAVTEKEVQELTEKWWQELNEIGTYSLDAFAGLGELYVQDERFTENIDSFGEGLAAFMREAMKVFVKRQRSGN